MQDITNQERSNRGKLKRFINKPIVSITIVILGIVIFFFAGAVILELPSHLFVSNPGNPLSYDYDRLFYNTKCMNTDNKYNEYDILETLYYLGIPKERAKELFQENKERLEQKIALGENMGTIERCQQETLDYMDMALNVLDNLSGTISRKHDEMQQNRREQSLEYAQ